MDQLRFVDNTAIKISYMGSPAMQVVDKLGTPGRS